MSHPEDGDNPLAPSAKKVGEGTRKMLRELIQNLNEPSPSREGKSLLVMPETKTLMEDIEPAQKDDEEMPEMPGATTKKKIKDLWENLKTQIMNETEETKSSSLPSAQQSQLQKPTPVKPAPSVTPPFGKSKIVLSKEEHEKLKALRKMK